MNQERFTQLAQAFGGDLDRWPDEVRPAAERWRSAHPDAAAVLAGERSLDTRLTAFVAPAPSMDLQRRIATRLLSERRTSRELVGWLSALAALLGAGVIGAGATAGAAMVAVAPAQPHLGSVGSIYDQSSFGDLGAVDAGGQDDPGA